MSLETITPVANASDIRAAFERDGYYHAKGVFDAAALQQIEGSYDAIVRQLLSSEDRIDATWDGSETAKLARADDVILHTHNVQRYSRTWLDAFLAPSFLGVVGAILGPDIILHHSELFQKPSENGPPFPMHQDWPYFPTANDSMIAGIIHVSDATDEMGCLRVYSGSHRWGRIEGANGPAQNDVLDAHPIEDANVIEAEAGDVIFIHYFTLHGSMPNRSDKTRKSILCQLYAGDDHIEAGNEHPDEQLVLRGWNHHISREAAGKAKS
ncbi:MAG: phytanoyl-CoA dioxygenase family protein [Rhodobacteraceae bacterium]|nr:phytanoyl-CoA dioxygenase family protein [Paracoccaceae bacterium]